MSGAEMQEVVALTSAIELVAAGSWAVEHAVRRLAQGDVEQAAEVLERGRAVVRDGLDSLKEVLDAAMQAQFERPERLARAIESLRELQELQLEPVTITLDA